jgi:hypothetical protein
MSDICGLPQPLTGAELVTIHQEQNGNLAKCSMPLSEFQSFVISNWLASLSTTKPNVAGVAWNDSGVIAIS